MPMTYQDLIGPKSNAGSIHKWVNHASTPVEVILTEAQALIYSLLRVREMRVSQLLTLPQGAFSLPLPDRFLEAIALRDRAGLTLIPSPEGRDTYISEADMAERRGYDPDAITTLDGALTSNATAVAVEDGTQFPDTAPFPIVIDAEIMLVTEGAGTDSWTVTRGFAGSTAAAHSSGATVDGQLLGGGIPCAVAIFDERYQFDVWADEARYFSHVFFQTPADLSKDNNSNFLTRRYPSILRVACQARSASFWKDTEEFNSRMSELGGLIDAANAESDLGRPG